MKFNVFQSSFELSNCNSVKALLAFSTRNHLMPMFILHVTYTNGKCMYYNYYIMDNKLESSINRGDLRSLCEELGYFIKPETCMVSTRMLYHTADGSCNNLRYPSSGKAGLPHKRYLPAEYGDGNAPFSFIAEVGSRTLPRAPEQVA